MLEEENTACVQQPAMIRTISFCMCKGIQRVIRHTAFRVICRRLALRYDTESLSDNISHRPIGPY